MPHLHSQPSQYDLTASAFIYRKGEDGQYRAFLHWHLKLEGWYQFGGHIEHNENVWQALVHEVAEESGYGIEQLQVLQPDKEVPVNGLTRNHPIPFRVNSHAFDGGAHYHNDFGYAFITDQLPKGKPDQRESQKLKWFSKQELRALGEDVIPSDLRASCEYGFELLSSWYAVDTIKFDLTNPQ